MSDLNTQALVAPTMPQNIPYLYSNNISLKVSLSDIGIIFGHEAPPPPQVVSAAPRGTSIQQISAQWDIMVTVSYVAAKVLSETLSLAISEYEAQVGPIKVAKGSHPNPELMKKIVSNMIQGGVET
jgi:hypothetical protein